MEELLFKELRESNKIIQTKLDEEQKKECYNLLAATTEKVLELCNLARKEGLLALEEETQNLEELQNEKHLKSMMMLIVDGTDPELVEEISTARMFASNMQGAEELNYLIMLMGCLSLQRGENPRIIEEKLLALLPEEAVDVYRERQKIKETKKESTTDSLERYYQGEIAVQPEDAFYYEVKIADYAIRTIDDRGIQRVLRDIDNCDITIAMKGLSGEARRRLLQGMSKRLATMIIEDMEFMGPVRMKDVVLSISKIYGVIVRLLSVGDIVSADGDALCLFSKIFTEKERESRNVKKIEAENELYLMMKEYNSSKNRIVDITWTE